MFPSVFQTFIERSPICVMAHAALENLFQPERLDELFARTAQRQYKRTLLFSSVVELMHSVVLGVEPNGQQSILLEGDRATRYWWVMPSPDGRYWALEAITGANNVWMVENF